MVACHIVNGCDLDGLSKARAVSMSVCVESTRSLVITIMSGPLSDSIRSSTDTVQNATPFFRENLFFTPFPLLCPCTDGPSLHHIKCVLLQPFISFKLGINENSSQTFAASRWHFTTK